MSRDGDGAEQYALAAFEILHSATLRAIRAGAMRVVPCSPDGIRDTVSVKGRHYRLESVAPGTLGDFLESEPEAMAKQAGAMQTLIGIAGLTEQAIRQNEQLRALLSPLEMSVMFTKRDESNEILSTETFKKIR